MGVEGDFVWCDFHENGRIKSCTCVCVYLGEYGEISCLSLAQLMMGGGTLWTSHGKTASSPSITDIFVGPAECSSSPALDLGRTGRSNTQTFNSSLLAFRHVDMVKLTC